ncbi:MAG TPA: porin [Steroidobacteraceae bacterium]|nr:porin [Steroidobacteraceae bacterium]
MQTSNRTLIAAVASALGFVMAAPAVAQQAAPASTTPAAPATVADVLSNVTVYGTILPFLETIEIDDATSAAPTNRPNQVAGAAYTGIGHPSRTRITSGTSNVGVKGFYDLTGDLRAWYQLESALQLDGDGNSTMWMGRNTGAGLTSQKYGTLMLGRWDTPYKVIVLDLGPLRGLNPYDNALSGNPGFNTGVTITENGRVNKASDASFNRRQGNVVQYWSPKWHGLSGRLAYSVDEGRTADTATASGTSPDLVSLALTYDRGGLSLRYGYELHNDYFGLSQLGGTKLDAATGLPPLALTGSKDEGHELVAAYKWHNTRLTAVYERLSYENDDTTAAAVTEWERDGWYVSAAQQFGTGLKHKVWIGGGMNEDGTCSANGVACGTDELGVTQLALGYVYSFNKRTDVYASAYQIANDESASYAGFPPVGKVAPGSDTTGVGIGLLYTF